MNELMNEKEMTPIEIALAVNDDGNTTTMKLYEFLGFRKSDYSRWIQRNLLENSFAVNGEDYSALRRSESSGKGKFAQDYYITAQFAKKLAMMSKSEKGEQARDYFIKVEDKLKEVAINSFKIPQTLPEALRAYADEVEKNAKLIEKNKELEPKAEYTDKVLQSTDLVTTTVIASEYGLSARKFNEILWRNGIQHKSNGTWVLYAKYKDKGYTGTKTHSFVHNSGDQGSSIQMYWTEKGRKFLYDYLAENTLLKRCE